MEQNKITIEFFHDVLCAWCYAISPRIEKLTEEYHGRIEVIHRSFALALKPDGIENIFGSKEERKNQILEHWRAANINDDEHRINAELMAQRSFNYPYSTPGYSSLSKLILVLRTSSISLIKSSLVVSVLGVMASNL